MSERLDFTRLDEYGRKRLIQVSVILFIVLALYFLCAGGVNLVWAWIYLKATDRPARRPFVPERELYGTCQSLKKDRKRSISAATSYNPSI